MQKRRDDRTIVLSRTVDGRTETVELTRYADTVWILNETEETIIGPVDWQQTWDDLQARGFVEVYPNDQRKLDADKQRVLSLVRTAFHGVTLGTGIGLRQGRGLDDYADDRTLASYREQDEKHDWSAISVANLDACYSSLSFFDAAGMRFHLPAYLVADLEGSLLTANVLLHLVHLDRYMTSQFDTLSPAQREAVRQYLLLHLSDNHCDFYHPMIETALRDYWNAHTES